MPQIYRHQYLPTHADDNPIVDCEALAHSHFPNIEFLVLEKYPQRHVAGPKATLSARTPTNFSNSKPRSSSFSVRQTSRRNEKQRTDQKRSECESVAGKVQGSVGKWIGRLVMDHDVSSFSNLLKLLELLLQLVLLDLAHQRFVVLDHDR
jgi:hypothetical protein